MYVASFLDVVTCFLLSGGSVLLLCTSRTLKLLKFTCHSMVLQLANKHAGYSRDTRIPPQLKCTHAKAEQFTSTQCKLLRSHVANIDVVVFRHKDSRFIRLCRNQAQPKCSNSLSPSPPTQPYPHSEIFKIQAL